MGDMENNLCEPLSSLVHRTSRFFNNKRLSDLQFQVSFTDRENVSFYAHKFIMAMASNYFEENFYGESSQNTHLKEVVKVSDSNPHAVYVMLRYVYCDVLSLSDTKEAAEVLKLASKYSINDLEKKCKQFILSYPLSPFNIFELYETAMLDDVSELRTKCRKLICARAEDICHSDAFLGCSLSVMDDILKLNSLNISDELTLTRVVLKWGERECKRKGHLSLREAINPLLKHLRLLTLTPKQYMELVKEYNIFSAEESSAITFKLCNPNLDIDLPHCLCPLRESRQRIQSHYDVNVPDTATRNIYTKSKLNVLSPNYTSNNNIYETERDQICPTTFIGNKRVPSPNHVSYSNVPYTDSNQQYQTNYTKYVESLPTESSNKLDTEFEQLRLTGFIDTKQKAPSSKHGISNLQNIQLQPSSPIEPNSRAPFEYLKWNVSNTVKEQKLHVSSIDPKQKLPSDDYITSVSNPESTEESTYMFFKQCIGRSVSYTKGESTKLQDSVKKATPLLKVNPRIQQVSPYIGVPRKNTRVSEMFYEFPLSKTENNFSLTANSDIKCSVNIIMKKGNILVHGLDLRISNLMTDVAEPMSVYVDANNVSHRIAFSDELNFDLIDDNLQLLFPEPFLASPGDPLDIDVLIEDLRLNRCCSCYGKQLPSFKLNSGLNVYAEITLKSNQGDGKNSNLILISRLRYSVCPSL